MCGFMAMFGQSQVDYNWERANGLLEHRGPDDRGDYVDPNGRARILFRRLSILDLAGGHQPVFNHDRTVVVVLNGEIYNYRELRSELIAQGVQFRTQGDSEVIAHLYDIMGPKLVERLEGMFAIVIWDEKKGVLHAMRDRFGIKPLYLVKTGTSVALCSEIRPLLSVSTVGRELSEQGLVQYLSYGYTLQPNTIYRDVEKVPAATHLEISDAGIRSNTFWDVQGDITSEWSMESLLAEFDRAIELHLRSDVKVGAFLSGGFDSGLVVARAAHHLGTALSTYTIRFADADVDEASVAEDIARRYRTNHRTFNLTSGDLLENLPTILSYFDEPVADSGVLPNHFISKKAAEDGCKVVLAGTGGDEIFAGYPYHVPTSLEGRLAPIASTLRLVGTIVGGEFGRKLIRTGSYHSDPAVHYRGHTAVFPNPTSFLTSGKQDSNKTRWLGQFRGDRETARLYADLHTYVPDNLMYLFDRTTMASSIEGRVPFLHHPLVEMALRVPASERTPDGQRKGLLREIAKPLLPSSVFNLPKLGFNSPVKKWMEAGLREEALGLLSTERAQRRPWWNQIKYKRLLNSNLNFHQIWTLYQLELFCCANLD
ncbi:MAG: asparagine synthase (glutamine-hydrolyzing) [Bdellovibrionales bacterium]|nr:asparagine synthase (glutamine-hydrolyzing) [Bdellovibrionales bacterium]